MVSHVLQQGDCNSPATHQALMNHILLPYIGCLMDIYLDDIVVYLSTLGVGHVKTREFIPEQVQIALCTVVRPKSLLGRLLHLSMTDKPASQQKVHPESQEVRIGTK